MKRIQDVKRKQRASSEHKDFKRKESTCNEIKTSSAKQGFEAQTRTSNETQEVARKERLRTKRKQLLSIPWLNYRDTSSKEKDRVQTKTTLHPQTSEV